MWRTAIFKLSLQYSLFFLVCLAILSFGLFQGVDNTFDKGYITEVEKRLGQNDDLAVTDQQHRTVEAAAQVAVDHFRISIILVDVSVAILAPLASYLIARRSLRPLQEANKRQKRFVSNASHELRTPLAVMSGELELALKQDRDKKYYRDTIISSKEEVERLNGLTNQLLEMDRIEAEAGKGRLKKTRTSINDLVNKSIKEHRKMAHESSHDINYYGSKDHIKATVNAPLIQTAFNNLLVNALKYSKPSTPVNVYIEKNSRHIVINIENVPKSQFTKEEREKIFERFYQTKNEDRKFGYGLGLSIVKSVVDAHQGEVTASAHGDKLRFSMRIKDN